jgi:hypothetical protein
MSYPDNTAMFISNRARPARLARFFIFIGQYDFRLSVKNLILAG